MKKLKQPKRLVSIVIAFILIFSLIILIKVEDIQLFQPSWFVPSVKASDMMKHVSAKQVEGKEADSKFITNTADFSIELFKNSLPDKGNSMISPVSVMLPLAMTANGAEGNTLTEMTNVLGKDIPLKSLNEYLYSFRKSLKSTPKSTLHISNSIWFRDSQDFKVENSFLQTNADYYNASVYKSAFNNQTLRDINNWVKKKTNGNIDHALDKIDNDSLMFLINTLEFDAKWKKKYEKDAINDNKFYNKIGSVTECKFMTSKEDYYLDDGQAIGFIKPYYNDHYRFVALLPNGDIDSYIKQMTGEKFIETLNHVTNTTVTATMPEFHYEYSIEMKDALSSLGMPSAFSQQDANFSKLGDAAHGDIFMKRVIQKTYIYVDDHGTKAGAFTVVEMDGKSSPDPGKVIDLDRPFVYAIVDSKTNIPIFLGVVNDMGTIGEY